MSASNFLMCCDASRIWKVLWGLLVFRFNALGNPLCLLSKHSLYHSSFIIEPDISDVVWLVQSIMMLLQCSGIPSLCVIEVGWNFSNHFMIFFAHSIDYTCLSLQMFSNISFSVMKPSAPTPGKQWWICFMSLLISFLFIVLYQWNYECLSSITADVCSLKEARWHQDYAHTIDFLSLNSRDLSFSIHLVFSPVFLSARMGCNPESDSHSMSLLHFGAESFLNVW